MSGVEIGVIRTRIGFDHDDLADAYGFGRSDFEGFSEFSAIPKLVVYNRDGSDFGVVVLADEEDYVHETLMEEQIDDRRSVFYNPQRKLVELRFEGISEGAIVDERIPLSADALGQVNSLLSAYRMDIEQGKPGEPGYLHFISIL